MARELCFNERSLPVAQADRQEVARRIADMSDAISVLVHQKLADPVLRMGCSLTDLVVQGDATLYDYLIEGLRGEHSERSVFMMGLLHKVPCEADLSGELVKRSLEIESESVGLLWSMVGDFVACSVAGDELWRQDKAKFSCDVLNEQGSVERYTYSVDHVSIPDHAYQIVDRHLDSLAVSTTSTAFWADRAVLLPHLSFGLDVEAQIAGIDEAEFRLILGRLRELDATAKEWKQQETSLPRWRSYITPESESAKKNPKVVSARTFKDDAGAATFFEWHARFGGGGRIHILFEKVGHKITVGYCGNHLYLP